MIRTLIFIKLTLIALMTGSVFPSFAQENVQELFDNANSLYMNEKYKEAVEVYLSIIDKGYENSAVYFNLGNTYYKIGNTGKAVLFYEKAKKINPTDDDIITNLKMVNLTVADKITPLPELFYVKYFKLFTTLLGPFGWMKIFLILFCILCFTICIRIIVRNDRAKYILNKSVFVLSAVTIIIFAVTVYSSDYVTKHNSAVIMSERVDVYSSPDEDSTELFTVHEGTKVFVKRTQEQWLEITLADGKVGWIIKSHVETI